MKTKSIGILLGLFLLISIAAVSAGVGNDNGNGGSIWTTKNDCGNVSQDVNQYNLGDQVYVNGANFGAGNHSWTITGLGGSNESGASCDPGIIVANGNYSVNSNGSFCFNAYNISSDDCGEYKVEFNNKKDNYGIKEIPLVPEFGLTAGLFVLASSIGIFFFVRRN